MKPIYSYSMDVRWRELDALGHVNNAQYLSYVEETRVQWFNAMQDSWQAGVSSPIVAGIHVDFRKPLHWPERICVHLLATKIGTKSVTIGHQIVSANNADYLYAEGYTVLVWMDNKSQVTSLPEYVRHLFSEEHKPNVS
jgi:acyl-CoA thioester hydrolase